MQKFKETGYSRYNYQNKLDNAYFPHDVTYTDFKGLLRTAPDKRLHDKAFDIAKNPKYDGYEGS